MIEFKERLRSEPISIGIIGNIGVGKSTLAQALADRFGIDHVEEKFPENLFLKDFYNDHNRWSFDTQYKFFLDKIDLIKSLDPAKSKLIDPEVDMDFIYALTHLKLGYMDPREWSLYEESASILKEVYKIKEPDVSLRLQAPLEVIVQRIKKRNRPFEAGLIVPPYTYLRTLESVISEYADNDLSGRIINVYVTDDFLTNEARLDGLEEEIKRKLN